jgi:MFS family permease
VSRTVRPLAAVLAADIISTTGSEMTAVALPWLVLVSTGSPTRTGAVLAAEFLGLSVLGLAGGGLAARLGSRRMMLTADACRAVLIGLIPFGYAHGGVPFPALLAVAFAVGSFFPAYSASQRLVVAGVLGDDERRLTRFGGLANAVNETASFVGPALGGVLIAVLGAPNVLTVDALSYLAAFTLIAAFVPSTVDIQADENASGIRAGLRYLFGQAWLRREVLGVGLLEVGFTALTATLPVLALHSGAGPRAAGWLLGAYGAGSVLGGLLATRRRFAAPRVGPLALIGFATAALALTIPSPLWTKGVLVGVVGVAFGLYFPGFFAMVTVRTPPAQRATVLTALNVVISAPGPVGFLVAGVLNQIGAGAGLLLVAVAGVIGVAIVIAARTGRTRTGSELGDGLEGA